MTDDQICLRQKLQILGFTKGARMKLYGLVLDFLSEPMVLTDDFVVIDSQEKKTGQMQRVGIPLPVVLMAIRSRLPAWSMSDNTSEDWSDCS